MPADLLETELFGSERQLHTGSRNGLGKIERAERGTIFLDEITEMPLALQGQIDGGFAGQGSGCSDGDKTASADVEFSLPRAPALTELSRRKN